MKLTDRCASDLSIRSDEKSHCADSARSLLGVAFSFILRHVSENVKITEKKIRETLHKTFAEDAAKNL
ncbi:MAG: hypothetical protein K5884_03265 [Ruminococcus sp.]|nr:hypothetical protein [Ruminococcus sp.]